MDLLSIWRRVTCRRDRSMAGCWSLRRLGACGSRCVVIFFFQAEDGIRDRDVTGVQTCALPISCPRRAVQLPGTFHPCYSQRRERSSHRPDGNRKNPGSCTARLGQVSRGSFFREDSWDLDSLCYASPRAEPRPPATPRRDGTGSRCEDRGASWGYANEC